MSAADLNVDEFMRDAAKTLLRLHGAFPQPVILYVEDLIGTEPTDEFGLHSPRHLACFNTLLWLAAEGYLRFSEPIKQEALDQAVLTERSFLKLHRPPVLGEPAPDPVAPNHLSAIRAAVKARSSTRLKTVMMAFLEDR